MEHVNAFWFYISLFFFLLLFYWPWQRLCVDWARQLMFEERDKLFMLGVSGELPFESHTYRQSRRQIEKMIRFCHRITWQTFVVYYLTRRGDKRDKEAEARADEFIRMIKENRKIYAIFMRMSFAALVCMMGRSVVLGPIFLVLYFVAGRVSDTRESETTQEVFRFVKVRAERYDESSEGGYGQAVTEHTAKH
jgi:hypothetical protein